MKCTWDVMEYVFLILAVLYAILLIIMLYKLSRASINFGEVISTEKEFLLIYLYLLSMI